MAWCYKVVTVVWFGLQVINLCDSVGTAVVVFAVGSGVVAHQDEKEMEEFCYIVALLPVCLGHL